MGFNSGFKGLNNVLTNTKDGLNIFKLRMEKWGLKKWQSIFLFFFCRNNISTEESKNEPTKYFKAGSDSFISIYCFCLLMCQDWYITSATQVNCNSSNFRLSGWQSVKTSSKVCRCVVLCRTNNALIRILLPKEELDARAYEYLCVQEIQNGPSYLLFFLSFLSLLSLQKFFIYLTVVYYLAAYLQVPSTLTLRLLMSYIYIYIYGAPILDVSRSYTTTHHSR